MRIGDFERAVTSLYEAALDPDHWRAATLAASAYLRAGSIVLQVRNLDFSGAQIVAATANLDPIAQQSYAAHYAGVDPWGRYWPRGRPEAVLIGEELVRTHDVVNSEFYTDFARAIGICQFLGGGFPVSRGLNAFFAVHRSHEAQSFDSVDKDRFNRLLPHVKRTLQLQARLASNSAQTMLQDVLSAIRHGAVIVDEDARVLFANSAAESLLSRESGLLSRQGRLVTQKPSNLPPLRQAISATMTLAVGKAAEASSTLTVEREGKRPLALAAFPLCTHGQFLLKFPVAVLLLISDPDQQSSPIDESFCRMYGLTRAERRLLQAVVEGERLKDYADRVGISINTAATQLKSIFAKTDTSRQSELIRLWMSSLANLIRIRV